MEELATVASSNVSTLGLVAIAVTALASMGKTLFAYLTKRLREPLKRMGDDHNLKMADALNSLNVSTVQMAHAVERLADKVDDVHKDVSRLLGRDDR